MSDELLYQGHGQIEIYPANTSILHIIGHELRHENFNRYIAFLKNKEVNQDIKITLQYKNGYLYPDKAYTEAKFKEKTKKEEIILKILYLKLKIKDLSRKDPDSLECKKYEKELEKLQRKFFSAENISNIYNFKKDFAKLIGFFRDIYFYQKYNLPPVSLNSPSFGNAYNVNQKLNEIYRKHIDDYEFQYKNISNVSNLNQNVKISALMDVYNTANNLNSFLLNFNINLKKAENNYSNYFTVIPDDTSENGEYNIKIIKTAKSFIVYSNKYDDIFESLNLSGTPKINGVEIEIEPDDSLYDIMEKINWGEDVNHNYQLDIDEGEDVNNNDELDGGTRQHGVYAYIEDNRLYLKNVETGNISMVIDDDNDIFHTLGIIAENPTNNLQYFPNIAQNGEDAEIELDGKTYTSHSDIFNLENLTIEIKKTLANGEFTITDNSDDIYNQIKSLINQYNSLIERINYYLDEDKPLENDYGLLLIKRGLKLAFFNNYSELNESGIDLKNDKDSIYQLELFSSIINQLKKFNNSIVDKLYSIGIKSNQDETISVDDEKLKNSIKNNPQQIKNLFIGSNGIKNNLINFLEKVLDNDYGIIESEVNKISMEDFKKLVKNFLKEKSSFDFIVEKLHSIEKIVGGNTKAEG